MSAHFESNPIARKSANLYEQILRKGISKGMRTRFLEEPPAPVPQNANDLEAFRTRSQILDSPHTKIGCEITFIIKGSGAEISSRVFIRNFELGLSLTLAEDIATLLAAKKTLVWWLSEGKEKELDRE